MNPKAKLEDIIILIPTVVLTNEVFSVAIHSFVSNCSVLCTYKQKYKIMCLYP